MSARTLQVAFATTSCAYIRGHGSRELYESVRGRPPVWSSRFRAWVAQPATASDLIAIAESRRWQVEIVSEVDLLRMAGVEVDEEKQRRAEARGELFG